MIIKYVFAKGVFTKNYFIFLCHQTIWLCSLMDKIKDSGSFDVGSIPARVTAIDFLIYLKKAASILFLRQLSILLT